ncbi:MAG: 30S ribosomal protein S6 [Acidimicrobiales bacterium]
MRPYEVMIILEPSIEEDAVSAINERVTNLSNDGGGTAGKVDKWGKRRLAYEINHLFEGYYVLIEAVADSAPMSEVDRMLRLADEVIRHKIIRLPEIVAGREPRRVPAAADADE